MTYPYQEINPDIHRPIVPIILKSNSKVIFYYGLIDSGADYCLFSLEIARSLGVELRDENKKLLIGVGKDQIQGWQQEVELRINNKIYKTNVVFADMSDFGHGLLGQRGFFDQFDVSLSYRKKQIEIL